MIEKTRVIKQSYIALLSIAQLHVVLFGFVNEQAS